MATALPSNPATALDKTDEHSTTALYRAAIGGMSNGYYLPKFVRFEAADRPGLSWNWAAALNTLNWLMFRQLWQAALVYSGSIVAIALLGVGIGKLVFQFSDGLQWGLLAAVVGLAVVVPGLGGNALYFLATRDRVQKALAKHPSVAEACIDLSEKASTRKGLIVVAIGNAVVLGIAVQSYSMFAGFEPLPFGSPAGTPVSAAANPGNGMLGGLLGGLPQAAKSPAGEAPKPAPSAPAAPAATPTAALAAPPAPASSEARNVASGKIESGDSPTPPAAIPASPPSAPASAPSGGAISGTPAPTISAAKPAISPAASPLPTSAPTKKVAAAPAPMPVPMPVPMRSAAADSAAREVAAAMAQTLPVRPTPTAGATPASGTAPAEANAPAAPSSPAPNSPPAAKAPAEKAQASRFVVNVGLFSDANAARNALVKLSDADIPVIRKAVRAASGNRTLLQAGPYDTVAEADAAADKMRALGIEGRVATLP